MRRNEREQEIALIFWRAKDGDDSLENRLRYDTHTKETLFGVNQQVTHAPWHLHAGIMF